MKKRNSSIDIIRLVALFGVVGVHFFLNTGFYEIQVSGAKLFFAITVRSFFMYCVPLFIMITGYLMNKKTLSRKYYKGIIHTYITYVVISIILLIFSNIYFKTNYSIEDGFFKILDFSAANYSWYIEMYLGLFLLIPFINLMYHGLESKKHKQILILTFITLTALPLLLNYNEYRNWSWWLQPAKSYDYDKIVPQFWEILYPLTYYFIGAYICEYQPKIKRSTNIMLLILATLAAGAIGYYRSFGGAFSNGQYQGWGSIQYILIAYFLFVLLLNIDSSGLSQRFKNILRMLSNASLGAYLISYMFDKLVYTQLNSAVTNVNQKYMWFPITTLLVFSLSLVSALIIDVIIKRLGKLIGRNRTK